MENINPQYTYDHAGNPVGVFLPIEEWNAITGKLNWELPGWQKKLLDERLSAYQKNPSDILDWENVVREFDEEDERA